MVTPTSATAMPPQKRLEGGALKTAHDNIPAHRGVRQTSTEPSASRRSVAGSRTMSKSGALQKPAAIVRTSSASSGSRGTPPEQRGAEQHTCDGGTPERDAERVHVGDEPNENRCGADCSDRETQDEDDAGMIHGNQ